jgi:hypothetical protein
MQTQLVIHVVALDILCYITYERDHVIRVLIDSFLQVK